MIVTLAVFSVLRVRREYLERDTLTYLTAVLVWGLYLLQLTLACYVSWNSLWTLPMPRMVAIVIGVCPLVCGLAMMVAAMVKFRSMRRVSGRQVDQLITTGIYRLSRHPQNFGWALLLVGIAIIGRSGAGLLLAALFSIMFQIYLPVEERYLERMFGDEYRQYRERTARLFGSPRH